MTSRVPSNPATSEGAVIIAFPARPKPVVPDPNDRLTRALASLNAAMEDQRAAVAGWRAALGDLKTTTTALNESLLRYQAGLGTLESSVFDLHTQAQTLEEWADRVVAE